MKPQLAPLTQADFDAWIPRQKIMYKKDIVAMGMSEEEAEKKAENDFQTLLPKGLESPGQYLFKLLNAERTRVGFLWFGIRGEGAQKRAFIYDVIVEETFRGQGLGKVLMQLCEEEVKKLGLKTLGLHVFGHNSIARKLYLELGFRETSVQMEKQL